MTGQEDPVILHAVINTLPIQAAYKEGTLSLVHNFYVIDFIFQLSSLRGDHNIWNILYTSVKLLCIKENKN